jgi:hypothetical protein
MNTNESPAYLVLVTWPNGTESLLFPRPGNVPVAATPEQGQTDFETAKKHLLEYDKQSSHKMNGTKIRLILFDRRAILNEFSIP